MRKSLFAVILVLLAAGSCAKKESVTGNFNVIPLPQSLTENGDTEFVLKKSTKIVYPAGNDRLKMSAEFLSDYIELSTGMRLDVTDREQAGNAITLGTDFNHENDEAYKLTVDKNSVSISGSSDAGVFYGIQTLRKAIPVAENACISLPGTEITDYPRFGYRGAMLDVGRYTFPVEFVKKFIDNLALHNMNRFHWHLTEDQGWRIEIKKYPALTGTGSVRKETIKGHLRDRPMEFDGKPYGGYFTQEEAREIVRYAADRHIEIIPEIDMPGHMLAALAAYPELGCTGGPYEVSTKWGIHDLVLCAGEEKVYEFVENVLLEIMDIFPSETIHIGGDECPKKMWKECPKCQAKIKRERLKADKGHSAENRLQSYFITRVEKFLNGHGRSIIGWDEILEGGLAPNATVMSWRGVKGGIEAAKQGHNAVMSPQTHLYFDYYQSDDKENEPLAIGGFLPLSKVYSYEPFDDSLTDKEKSHIIGVQANLWTEYIPTGEYAEYMFIPRVDALAEIQWTMPQLKNYEDFLDRLSRMAKLYDKLGYNYAKHVFNNQ